MPRAFAKNLFFSRYAQRENVHQRVRRIARFELHFAADGRNAKAVSVMPMPRTTPSRMRRFFAASSSLVFFEGDDLAEPQRIENGDRPRTHSEDVAQDTADAGVAPWKGST